MTKTEYGYCLCNDVGIEGRRSELKVRPDDLLDRGGFGKHKQWQCPRCYGWWVPATKKEVDDANMECLN